MIEKPTIIITSIGRTGTKFFSTIFQAIVPHSISIHEPDVLNIAQYSGTRERLKQIAKQIQGSGVFNLIIRKSLGRWSLVELSDARVRGHLSHKEAVCQVLRQRESFILSKSETIYIESNVAYYGLIDVLNDVYQNHRVVYIIRDGRDWVRSSMSWGQMYNKGRVRSMIAHTWPTALEFEDDPYHSKWGEMSRFEKLCWAWAKLNEYALKSVEKNPNARVFYFEDIFKSADRYQHLADLVEFTTTFSGGKVLRTGTLEGWLERQVHQSRGEFPSWSEWSVEYKRQFENICGPLMMQLGYELD